jgi:hypothetical protein
LAVAALLAAGCAGVDPYAAAPMRDHLQRADAVGECARWLREVDRHVDALGRRDGEAPRVAGFPYLRVDRPLAALGEVAAGLPPQEGFAAWSAALGQLDRRARAAELRNAALDEPPQAAQRRAGDCRERLRAADAGELATLRAAARVPDDYSLVKRALGLYPLTRLAFAAGIRGWHRDVRGRFALPLEALPVEGELVRYAPPAAVEALPPQLDAAALGAPPLEPARLRDALLRHAPVLEVDTASDDDVVGALAWRRDGAGAPVLAVGGERPAGYVQLAYTRIAGRLHPQLVYTFWFPARPPAGPLDVLAGRLDGLIWRVTLDAALEPLVYDTIHPCGCFHLFFPTARVRARPQPQTLDEGLFAPQVVAAPGAAERIVLRVASRSHYIERVRVEAQAAAPPPTYVLRPADELRSLPLPGGGFRSAFGPDGLVPGSERPERWLFWPMGIASAGQMRQWGRHATAFVGRRHFDDPDLFERYFIVDNPLPGTPVRPND